MASKVAHPVPAPPVTVPPPSTKPQAAVAIAIHTASRSISATASASNGPLLSKEVKLDELSKYFHLPEKAVAKELGICLTSLKKLCRSYGITRWPFRKLKSLERTMRKVQTESEAANSGENGDDASSKPSNEVKRKPYTVGNKTVFLSDEELEVFKMTMGKEQANELVPTPMSQLEPALVHNATMAATSSALASVARPPQTQVEDGSGFLNEEEGDRANGRRQMRPLSGCSPASLEGTEDCVINARVVGNSLEIHHWSTLWSQPQLKRKLLIPLNGIELYCSRDGTKATLDFANAETANRALRICNMAQSQASLLPADCSTGQRGGKKDSSKAMAALDIITPAVALPIEFAHPRGLTPPSSSTQLGVPAAPQTNMHSMLAESCGAQPPSTSASNGPSSLWAAFLGPASGPCSMLSALTSGGGAPGVDAQYVKEESTRSGKGLGLLGESLPSPPMSSSSMAGMIDSSLAGPLSSIFPNMFQMNGHGKGSGSGVTPPQSTDSLGSYLQDENIGEASGAAAGEDQHKSGCDSPSKGAGEKSVRSSGGGAMCSPRAEKRRKCESSSSPPLNEPVRAKDSAGTSCSKTAGKDGKEASVEQKDARKASKERASGVKEPAIAAKETPQEAAGSTVPDPLAAAAAAAATAAAAAALAAVINSASVTKSAGDGPGSDLRSASAGDEVSGVGDTSAGSKEREMVEDSGNKSCEKAGASTRARRSSTRTSTGDLAKSPEKKTGIKRQR